MYIISSTGKMLVNYFVKYVHSSSDSVRSITSVCTGGLGRGRDGRGNSGDRNWWPLPGVARGDSRASF